MKGATFNDIQYPKNWKEETRNEGVFWYMVTSHFSAEVFYYNLKDVETGLSFSEPSEYFANNFTDGLEFFDILEKTKPKKEVLQVLEYCYLNITTCGAFARVAVALLGESTRVEFYLEEEPVRIVFNGVGEQYDAWLTTPNHRKVITTADGLGIVAVGVQRQIEATNLLKEFFMQWIPPETDVVFEFNV